MSAASARIPTVEHGLSLWIVSDNLRKGAALQRRADRRSPDQSQITEECTNAEMPIGSPASMSATPRPTRSMSRPAVRPISATTPSSWPAAASTEVLEGNARARNVVIEFASMEDASGLLQFAGIHRGPQDPPVGQRWRSSCWSKALSKPRFRATLFVPGQQCCGRSRRARTLSCDAIILDLEDAVGRAPRQRRACRA